MNVSASRFRYAGMWGALVLLTAALAVATWKMFEFRDRLHALLVNQRWEHRLTEYGMYQDRIMVFFGDSQLALWRLAPSFGMLPIKNRGISGDQARRAVDRFQRDVLDEKATLVVILIGTNDLGTGQPVDAVTAAIDQWVDRALKGGVEVVLCSLLPVRGAALESRFPERVETVNRHLQARDDVTYVDFYTLLQDAEGLMDAAYTEDGLHPNERGYAAIPPTRCSLQARGPHASMLRAGYLTVA